MSELTPASHSIITFDRSAGDAYYEPLFPHNHQQHLSPKDHISNLRGENYRCLTLTTTSYQQHSPPGSPSYHSNHPQTIPQLPGLHVSHTTPRDEQKPFHHRPLKAIASQSLTDNTARPYRSPDARPSKPPSVSDSYSRSWEEEQHQRAHHR